MEGYITLKTFLETNTQYEAAKQLGIKQPSVCAGLKRDSEILVRLNGNGKIEDALRIVKVGKFK